MTIHDSQTRFCPPLAGVRTPDNFVNAGLGGGLPPGWEGELRTAWLAGVSAVRIGVMLDSTERLVRIEARRLGLPSRKASSPKGRGRVAVNHVTKPPRRQPARKLVIAAWANNAALQRMREMWAAGDSAKVIGYALGVSKNSIVNMRRTLDLPRRPSPIVRHEGWIPASQRVDSAPTRG